MGALGARLRGAGGWLAPLFVLLLFAAWIQILRPGSFTIDQLAIKCAAAMTLIFVATGETIVVLRGGIDLSVGGILSLASAIAATRADAGSFIGMLPWLVFILVLGAGIGTINGLLISGLRLQPFLVTLATWSIVEGVALIVQPAEGGTVAAAWFSFGYSYVLGLPISVFLLFVLIAWWAWFRRTRLASALLAAGSNERSAYLNRVSLTGTNVAAYGLSGLFAALAGFFYATQTGAGSPTVGTQYVLPAIAAVVIGGTSLAGGRGGLIGTIVGAFILNLIGDVVFLLKFASYWQPVASGLILVLVVIVTSLNEATSERGGGEP
jgi:ribose transport system permease protein